MAYDFAMNMFLIIPLVPLSFIENSILYSDYTARFLIPTVFVVGALTKDYKDGRSIGKRLRGFQVVDSKSNKVANSTQCIIRNLTFILWPLEALLILGTPEYRIGDFLARTKVVPHVTSDPIEILD
ncbi:hypothetical protein BGP76_19260 [Reichenbachiella sp. MSK19-1]|nr:hypothetical protein BGP76_19260 [Reichenbachiella sp. MSK19-1]